MADTDEAAIHLPTSYDSTPQIETDLSDETQDFRFLNQIAFATPDSSQSTLPRRGEKDFEPNPTNYQADVLAASRQAMHNALSWPRLHHSKNKVVAFYAPDGPVPPGGAEQEQEQKQEQKSTGGDSGMKNKKPVKTGVGVPAESCVYVPNPKGQYFKSIGRADRWNRVWLLPEEALYLLERGSLDIRWPVYDEGEDGEGIPLSLQAAYACFIGRGGLTMERFSVYTGLRRLGYTVVRAPGWDDDYDDRGGDSGSDPATGDLSTAQQKQEMGSSSVFGRFLQWLYSYGSSSSTGLPATGPVVGLGIHRNYNDIYSKLATIRYHDPTASTPPAATKTTTSPPFRVVFNIYKPSTTVKKSAPPPPDFRIAVVSTHTQTTIPTLSQLGALLESTPLDPPRGEKMDRMLYMRLRHGYRNVILAVVDQGVVSYLRVGDAAFGREKIYKEKGFQGGKRGGGGGPRPKKK